MSDTVNAIPSITVGFSLRIDDVDLGSFISCEGLGIEVEIEEREEGGGGAFLHQLPGRFRFSRLRLSRPVNSDTKKVLNWLNSMAGQVKRTNGEIRALSPDGSTIFSWTLRGIVPARWSGPSFHAGEPAVATETLEIAYEGLE